MRLRAASICQHKEGCDEEGGPAAGGEVHDAERSAASTPPSRPPHLRVSLLGHRRQGRRGLTRGRPGLRLTAAARHGCDSLTPFCLFLRHKREVQEKSLNFFCFYLVFFFCKFIKKPFRLSQGPDFCGVLEVRGAPRTAAGLALPAGGPPRGGLRTAGHRLRGAVTVSKDVSGFFGVFFFYQREKKFLLLLIRFPNSSYTH